MKANRPYAVYRMFDASGTLLYIGCTFSLLSRIKQHESIQIWSTDIATIRAEWFDDKDDAVKAEAMAIKTERPIWNIRDNLSPTRSESRFSGRATRADRLTWVRQ